MIDLHVWLSPLFVPALLIFCLGNEATLADCSVPGQSIRCPCFPVVQGSLSIANLETVLQCPCRTICSLSVWLSPYQPSNPHLCSYPVIIYSPHLFSSVAFCASRLAAYQDIGADDDLPCNVQHYSQVHEKNQVPISKLWVRSHLTSHSPKPSFYKVRSMMLSWLCSNF